MSLMELTRLSPSPDGPGIGIWIDGTGNVVVQGRVVDRVAAGLSVLDDEAVVALPRAVFDDAVRALSRTDDGPADRPWPASPAGAVMVLGKGLTDFPSVEAPKRPPKAVLASGPAAVEDLVADGRRELCDADLYAALAACCFAGPEYAAFEDRLVGFGREVLAAQLSSGEVFVMCARRGIGVATLELDALPECDAADLIMSTLASALVEFHKSAMLGGRWSPVGGVTLARFFLDYCYREFAVRVGRCRDQIARSGGTRAAGPDGPWRDRRLAPAADARVRQAVMLSAGGYTTSEIAETLADGTTAAVVDEMLQIWEERVDAS